MEEKRVQLLSCARGGNNWSHTKKDNEAPAAALQTSSTDTNRPNRERGKCVGWWNCATPKSPESCRGPSRGSSSRRSSRPAPVGISFDLPQTQVDAYSGCPGLVFFAVSYLFFKLPQQWVGECREPKRGTGASRPALASRQASTRATTPASSAQSFARMLDCTRIGRDDVALAGVSRCRGCHCRAPTAAHLLLHPQPAEAITVRLCSVTYFTSFSPPSSSPPPPPPPPPPPLPLPLPLLSSSSSSSFSLLFSLFPHSYRALGRLQAAGMPRGPERRVSNRSQVVSCAIRSWSPGPGFLSIWIRHRLLSLC